MYNKKAFCNRNTSPQHKQRGIVAVAVTIGLVALIAVTGLALDTGHLLLNKTRLQNAVDAAALAGARELIDSSSANPLQDAENEAKATFSANLSTELANSITGDPDITFSEDLTPGSFSLTPANPPNYLKVSTSNITLRSFLIGILEIMGYDLDKNVAATAVAGIGYGVGVCDMIPIMVCGDPTDTNQNDGTVFGYQKYDPLDFVASRDTINLKFGTAEGWDPEVGSGNFHLLNVGGTGGDVIRENLAGGSSCGVQDNNNDLDTAPGQKVGPLVSGINTRFGLYTQGLRAADYPPDYANQSSSSTCNNPSVYINTLDGEPYDTGTGANACLDPRNYYEAYHQNPLNWAETPTGSGLGSYQRRVVTMPIANCGADGDANGRSVLPTMGFGCFLLTRPAVQTGGATSDTGSLWGVFLEQCFPPTEGISEDSGATIVVLYKNPDGDDS
jgi:hypothetical protein